MADDGPSAPVRPRWWPFDSPPKVSDIVMLWEVGRVLMIGCSCLFPDSLAIALGRWLAPRQDAPGRAMAVDTAYVAALLAGNVVYCWGWRIIRAHWVNGRFEPGLGASLLGVAVLSVMVTIGMVPVCVMGLG